jgi:hypothetical protein
VTHVCLAAQIDELKAAQQGNNDNANAGQPTPARLLAMQCHAINPVHQARVAPLVAAAEAVAPLSDIKAMVTSLSSEHTVNGVDDFTHMPVLNGFAKCAGTKEPEKVKYAAVTLLLLMLRRIATTPGLYTALWAEIGSGVQRAGNNWSSLNRRFMADKNPLTKDQIHGMAALGLGMPIEQVKKLPGKCKLRTSQAAALAMLGMLMKAGVLHTR